jgi:3-oxoacyl-[acyl-carrier-protein] synthase III
LQAVVKVLVLMVVQV